VHGRGSEEGSGWDHRPVHGAGNLNCSHGHYNDDDDPYAPTKHDDSHSAALDRNDDDALAL
jgi:hypothetical protein